jgi:hypothetical protein
LPFVEVGKQRKRVSPTSDDDDEEEMPQRGKKGKRPRVLLTDSEEEEEMPQRGKQRKKRVAVEKPKCAFCKISDEHKVYLKPEP